MISYTIHAAQKSENLAEVYVNSDDQQCLQIATSMGAKPYLRDSRFAQDHSSMKDVVVDFVDYLSRSSVYFDALAVLYPTYPTRTFTDIDTYISFFLSNRPFRSIVGLKEPDTHPFLLYQIDENLSPTSIMDFEIDKYYRRQDYPVFFELSHWACVINRSDIALINSQLISPTVSGYLIPESDYVLDVDNFVDLQRAEQVLKHSVTF